MADETPANPTPQTPSLAGFTQLVNDLTGFIGNADVQKIIGLTGGTITATDVKTWTAKLACLSVGGAFALGVHAIDAVRAWIAKK